MSASHSIGFRKKQIRWSQTSTCAVNQILGRWTTTTKTISPELFPSIYCIIELVQSLSTCRHLTELNLGENDLNEAGHQLAQSIRSWGDDPPLQELHLSKCSLPATASLELVQSLLVCKHLRHLTLLGNDFDETGYHLAQSLRLSVQCLYLPDGPTVTVAQCYPSVAACRGGGDDISSDESNGLYFLDSSNSELEVYSETEHDEQLENEVRTIAGKAIQETVQGPRYREDVTEFGVNIRRYEDERPESKDPIHFDSVAAGAVGVRRNSSLGNNATDKYSPQKLPIPQVTNIICAL